MERVVMTNKSNNNFTLPENLETKWVEFQAAGFDQNVTGVIYNSQNPPVCGLPLGGIGTGNIDLNPDGTLGRCSIFNTMIPPLELGEIPFIGFCVGTETWVLSTGQIADARNASHIYYWGHYPMADLQYEMDCPIGASLRAWSPFIPGDAKASNIPAIIFEVQLENKSHMPQAGKIFLTFPGPSKDELQNAVSVRSEINQNNFRGGCIEWSDNSYALGAIDDTKIEIGGALRNSKAWSEVSSGLPVGSNNDVGVSVSIDYNFAPGEIITARFLLAWYCPIVSVNNRHQYRHAYSEQFSSVSEIVNKILQQHENLKTRIIKWQEVIYSENSLPGWLRDCLVNNFYLIAENGFWESNAIPPEPWAEETGIFSMVESARSWPGHSCVPTEWFGNLPILFFFPELSYSTLRGLQHYQLSSGEIPIYIGENYDRHNPVYQFLHVTTSCNYVDLVGRLWRRTQSESFLREFYESVKLAIRYLQGLDIDNDGIIDCAPGAGANQFYGSWRWYGAATHVAGMWLSALSIARQMALKMRDMSFANDCRIWLKMAGESLEMKLWNGDNYLLFNDVLKGNDDTVLANQLAGQWGCRLNGVKDIFPKERVDVVIETIKKFCMSATLHGAVTARRSDGSVNTNGGRVSTEIFVAEIMTLACTMMYSDHSEAGLEIVRRLMTSMVLTHGLQWDMPGFLNNETGDVSYGHDFNQMLILWAIPVALNGLDITAAVSPGSLVDRIIHAADM